MAKFGDVCCSDYLGRAGLGMLWDSPRRVYPSFRLPSPSQASPHKSHGWVPSIVSNFHPASSPILQFPPLPPCSLLGSPTATSGGPRHGSQPWCGASSGYGGPDPLLWVPYPAPVPSRGSCTHTGSSGHAWERASTITRWREGASAKLGRAAACLTLGEPS